MGLDINGTRFLIFAKTQKVDHSKTATIGRHGLHLFPSDLKKNFGSFGYQVDKAKLHSLYEKYEGYSEGFLHYLDADSVHSFDNSKYEKATHVHDMNEPIPNQFKGKYTTVIDAGSLEHVFHFPNAIKNCMEMLQVGGHFIGITPANNFFGHGFYQFSPECFFRVFSQENGFQLVTMILHELLPNSKWYVVSNPADIGKRVTLINKVPTHLLILAQKIRQCKIFKKIPQQIDYTWRWNRTDLQEEKAWQHPSRLAYMIKKYCPSYLVGFLKKAACVLWPSYRQPDFQRFKKSKFPTIT